MDTATVMAADNWEWKFTGLRCYSYGKEIVYTITEELVEGYTSEVSGYDVINTFNGETVEVSGRKNWNDANDQDGLRPDAITINLLANGQKIDSVTVTSANGWTWSFADLPKAQDGQEISYTITEEPVAGYETVVEQYNVTNNHTPETVEVSGAKNWDDADDQDGKRPASITINLLANGVQVDSVVVTEADGWVWEFTGLPLNANGEEIEYTITEDVTDDYISTVVGYGVYNTYDRTGFRFTKVWDGTEGGG